jgi:hypothetical protein
VVLADDARSPMQGLFADMDDANMKLLDLGFRLFPVIAECRLVRYCTYLLTIGLEFVFEGLQAFHA